jgi:protein subunit release factor A
MTEKEYKKISKKLEKLHKPLDELMASHQPKDIMEVLMVAAPPLEVELIGLFVANMTSYFIHSAIDRVWQAEAENSEENCEDCPYQDDCPSPEKK